MKNIAMSTFEYYLKNEYLIITKLRNLIYRTLDIKSSNSVLLEYIQSSIDEFDFNLVEHNFFNQIHNIGDQTFIKINTLIKNGENINYEKITAEMIENLNKLRYSNFSFQQDFVTLAKKICHKFNIEIAYDHIYRSLISKNDNILRIVNSHNNYIIDELVKISNLLPKELENLIKSRQNQKNDIQLPNLNITIQNDDYTRNGLINYIKNQYNHFQKRLSYLYYFITKNAVNIKSIRLEIMEITSSLKNLSNLIEMLNDKEYFQELIDKYSNVADINIFYKKVVTEVVPSVKYAELYFEQNNQFISSKSTSLNFNDYSIPTINIEEIHYKILNSNNITELLNFKEEIESYIGKQYYDINKRLEFELEMVIDKIITLAIGENYQISPSPSTFSQNISTSYSYTNILSLINSGNYYALLNGIKENKKEKFKVFINIGLEIILQKWRNESINFKHYNEQERSYYKLVEIFNNFKEYLSAETINKLKAYLDSIKKYLEENKPRTNYVSSRRETLF